MKPTLGRMVHVMVGIAGSEEDIAAIITKVRGSKDHDPAVHGGFAIVNLTIFPDGEVPHYGCGVPMFDTRFKAEQYQRERPAKMVCFWPERV